MNGVCIRIRRELRRSDLQRQGLADRRVVQFNLIRKNRARVSFVFRIDRDDRASVYFAGGGVRLLHKRRHQAVRDIHEDDRLVRCARPVREPIVETDLVDIRHFRHGQLLRTGVEGAVTAVQHVVDRRSLFNSTGEGEHIGIALEGTTFGNVEINHKRRRAAAHLDLLDRRCREGHRRRSGLAIVDHVGGIRLRIEHHAVRPVDGFVFGSFGIDLQDGAGGNRTGGQHERDFHIVAHIQLPQRGIRIRLDVFTKLAEEIGLVAGRADGNVARAFQPGEIRHKANRRQRDQIARRVHAESQLVFLQIPLGRRGSGKIQIHRELSGVHHRRKPDQQQSHKRQFLSVHLVFLLIMNYLITCFFLFGLHVHMESIFYETPTINLHYKKA